MAKQTMIADGVSINLDDVDHVIISVWDSKARKLLVWECDIPQHARGVMLEEATSEGLMRIAFRPNNLTIKETNYAGEGAAPAHAGD